MCHLATHTHSNPSDIILTCWHRLASFVAQFTSIYSSTFINILISFMFTITFTFDFLNGLLAWQGNTQKSHCPCLKTTSYEHGWVTQKGGSWLPRMLTQSSHPILGFCVAPDKGTAYIWISIPLSGLYISITRIFLILFHYEPITIFTNHSSPTTTFIINYIFIFQPPPFSYTHQRIFPLQVHTPTSYS